MDANIGILQYIKSGEVSIVNEISRIEANSDINIRVRTFFMNSPDFQKLNKEVERKKEQFETESDDIRKLHLSEELNNLYKVEKEFKIDVLRLADVFTKLDIRTKRLAKAKELFNQGRFKEADEILNEVELSNDQFNYLILLDYWEEKEKSLIQKLNAINRTNN